MFQIHTLIYSAKCWAIIQYNGCQKEEHSMEINLVILCNQLSQALIRESILLSNVILKNATK